MSQTRSSHSVSEHYADVFKNLWRISESYYCLGRLDDALHLLGTGLLLLQMPDVEPLYQMKMLLQYGKLLIATNFHLNKDFALTLPPLLHAKKLAESTGDPQGLADALDLIGKAHYYKKLNTGEGDYTIALEYFQQALERMEAIANYRGISEVVFYTGIIYERLEQPAKALELYQKALEVAEQHNCRLEKSYALRHIASLALDKGDVETAENYFAESLALREEAGARILLPFSHLAMGDVYYTKNDLGQASVYYENAVTLAEEMNMKVQLIFALLSLGDLRKTQNEMEQAREYVERAFALATEIQLLSGIAAATSMIESISEP